MKIISYLILKMMGWRVTHPMPKGVKKAVVIMAPHTSNWDFLIGRLGLYSHKVKIRTLIKRESFFFPLGIILKAMGAIPVDRTMSAGTIKKVAKMMADADEFFLLITPEGTRKLSKRWKKGFYFLAQQANVPIIQGFLDYRTKTGGMGPVYYPTGNYEEDLKNIQKWYYDKQAKHPENFNLSPENRQKDLQDEVSTNR